MRRRRYRTIHVAQLDRLMAEAEAIRPALAAGARDASVRSSERILDQDGKPVWETFGRGAERAGQGRRSSVASWNMPFRLMVAILLCLAATPACALLESEDAAQPPCTGLSCRDTGVIDVSLVVERCDAADNCERKTLKDSDNIFIQVRDLDRPDCRPDCGGGVPHALANEGWTHGRLEIIAPEVPDLVAPEPVVIDLEEGEREKLTLTYREDRD